MEEYKNGDVNAKSRRGYFGTSALETQKILNFSVIFNHLKFSGAAGEVNSKRDGTEHDVLKERRRFLILNSEE